MSTLGHDLRYAARMLRRSPAFTAVSILVLGLGIGANTAIFSVVNAFLLRPLPVADPGRLVGLFNHFPDLERGPASYADFEDWRDQSRTLEALSADQVASFNYQGRREPERIPGVLVSRDFLTLLGIKPVAGRSFLPADHAAGAGHVVLVSGELARRELGGREGALGRSITLNAQSYTVVGVLPSSWPGVLEWAGAEIWMPLEPSPPFTRRGTNYLTVIGRLRPGATLRQARTEMEGIQARINSQFPGNKHDLVLQPFVESRLGEIRPRLLLLLGAVAFVLLIACANVAGLTLVRAHGRVREFAIRAGLGAPRGRMVRQLLTEGVLLAVLGGGCGLLVGLGGIQLLLATWAADLPRPDAPGGTALAADWRVLCFTLVAALSAGLLCAVAPALRASRVAPNESLKAGAHGAGGSAGRTAARRLFVVAELALATVLLIGAGLMLRSLALVQAIDPGFTPERLLTLSLSVPALKYPEAARQAAFWTDLLARIASLPGVRAAGAVSDLPLSGGSTTGDFAIYGRPSWPAGQEPIVQKEIASPGYFEAMRIPLERGRLFAARDDARAPRVALISRELAQRFWPGEDPVGRRIDIGFGESRDWQEIVGVVGNVRGTSLDTGAAACIYVCSLQYPARFMSVVARTGGAEAGIAQAMRRQVFAVDAEQPVYRTATMQALVADSLSGRRMSSWLLGVFAALATLLAGVGIYGTTAYTVGQRTRELGVRMALGARRRQVLGQVLAEGARSALLGLVLGLAGALALTRFMTAMLYGVRATDLLTFAAVALTFAGVALLANLLPAWRASRVDPIVAMRTD